MSKTIIVHTVAGYIERKDKFTNATMIRKNGKSYILENGKEIELSKWEENNPFPIYVQFNDKGVTPDGRFDFLNKN